MRSAKHCIIYIIVIYIRVDLVTVSQLNVVIQREKDISHCVSYFLTTTHLLLYITELTSRTIVYIEKRTLCQLSLLGFVIHFDNIRLCCYVALLNRVFFVRQDIFVPKKVVDLHFRDALCFCTIMSTSKKESD